MGELSRSLSLHLRNFNTLTVKLYLEGVGWSFSANRYRRQSSLFDPNEQDHDEWERRTSRHPYQRSWGTAALLIFDQSIAPVKLTTTRTPSCDSWLVYNRKIDHARFYLKRPPYTPLTRSTTSLSLALHSHILCGSETAFWTRFIRVIFYGANIFGTLHSRYFVCLVIHFIPLGVLIKLVLMKDSWMAGIPKHSGVMILVPLVPALFSQQIPLITREMNGGTILKAWGVYWSIRHGPHIFTQLDTL